MEIIQKTLVSFALFFILAAFQKPQEQQRAKFDTSLLQLCNEIASNSEDLILSLMI